MRKHNRTSTKRFRRELRSDATYPERVLWNLLRKRQVDGRRFRRQHGIGPFIVDFYCPEERLIIEVDGSIHDDLLHSEYDMDRQKYLEASGFKVLRFPNDAVVNAADQV